MSFLKCESGAVTVDWTVLTASILGLGLVSAGSVSQGVRDLGQDVATALSSARVTELVIAVLPSAFSSDFEGSSTGIGTYHSGDRTAGFELSDALGSVSGDAALVITSGNAPNGGTTYGGAVIRLDQDELVVGARYRVSYWARTDGDTHQITLSNQSGSGDNSTLTHNPTVTGEWTRFTHEAVLNASRPVVYVWTQGANQTVAIDDLRYERLP